MLDIKRECDMTEGISSSNALTIQTSGERPYPFLSQEMMSSKRPSPFLSEEYTGADKPSPLTIKREENTEETKDSDKPFKLPKDSGSILSELRRNAMHSMMTARDIANEYNIPYVQAQEIYLSLNEDSNGVVREFNLPDNSTVSFLV